MMGTGILDWMDKQDITEEVTFEDCNKKDVLDRIFQAACSICKDPNLRIT